MRPRVPLDDPFPPVVTLSGRPIEGPVPPVTAFVQTTSRGWSTLTQAAESLSPQTGDRSACPSAL
jgi:hypothetical protein